MCASYRLRYRLRRSGGADDALVLEGDDGQDYFYAQGVLQLTLPLAEATDYLATLEGVEVITRYEHDERWFPPDELRRRWLDSRVSVSDPTKGSALMAELAVSNRHGTALPFYIDTEDPAPAPASVVPLTDLADDHDVSAA